MDRRDLAGRRIDRRHFVRGAAMLGGGALAAPLLACGGSTPGGSGSTNTPPPSNGAGTASPDGTGGTTPAAKPAAKNQTLVYANGTSPRSIDPANGLESGSLHVIRAAYEGLVAHKTGTTEIVPRLASEWKVSDDAQVYTFTLRPGVKFHDGTIMDATAVKKSFDRVREMNLGPASLLKDVDEIRVVDEQTVEIVLQHPHVYFLTYVAKIGIISPTAWEANDKGGDLGAAWLEENTAGTGPFRLTELRRNESTTLERFEDYWRGWDGDHLSKIRILVVPEASTRRQMLEAGDAHMVYRLSPDDLEQLTTTPGIRVEISKNFEIDIITLNVTKPPLDDLRVRQAFQYAFDYQGYLDKVLLGHGNLPTGPIAPDYPSFNPDLPPFQQDLDKAKQLLEEAGVTGLTLEANYMDSVVEQQQAALILQDALKQIGVTLELRPLPWSTMFKIAGNPDEASPLSNLMMATFTADPTFTLSQNYGCDFVGKPYNWSYYCNEEVDRLIAEAASTLDQEQSFDLLRQAQNLILADAPAIFYANPKAVEALSDRVQNHIWDPVDYYWQVDWYAVYLSD